MIKALFSYDTSGQPTRHNALSATSEGLAGNRPWHPWKQVLLLPESTLRAFQLSATDLKENILLDPAIDIHALPSGTVVKLGEVEIRLTFHCEPCRKIRHLASPPKLAHQRGYLGQVITPGRLSVGDALSVLEQRFDAIPYATAERIKWRVDQLQQPMLAATLVEDIGLSKSYCRTLPGLLRRHPEIDAGKILFASRRKKQPAREPR